MLKRLVIVAAVVFLSGYVAICGLLYSQQRRILFPAPASKKPAFRRLPGAGHVVVYFHGNAEAAGDVEWLGSVFPGGFVAIEYPGYGDLPGSPTETSIYTAAAQQLESLGIEKSRVVLVGQSIGTGPAVEMAHRGWGNRLVLLTPFTSVPDAAQLAFPWLPARWLVRDQFDSASKAKDIAMPVLVIHGDRDEVIPYELGQRLAPMFPHGRLLTVPGGHHNDLWDRAEVLTAIAEFLR